MLHASEPSIEFDRISAYRIYGWHRSYSKRMERQDIYLHIQAVEGTGPDSVMHQTNIEG